MAGVKGRSGRHKKILKLRLSELLDQTWPTPDRIAVVRQLHKAAIAGDVEAAKTLLFMAYGRPAQRHEISGPEGQPFEVDVNAVELLKQKLANLAHARSSSTEDDSPSVIQRPRLTGAA
jgi:hypothetical protein